MRCERCKTSELKLVTFGVYDCPVCGRVDADGNVLDVQAGADDTGPVTFDTVETGRASFVAPPPVGTPAAAVIPAAPIGRHDVPQLFLWTAGISAILDIAGLVATRNACGLVLRLSFYGALMTGKPWARAVTMFFAFLTMAMCVFAALVAPNATTTVKVIMTVLVVTNAWWLYVLLRPDTVAYFSRV